MNMHCLVAVARCRVQTRRYHCLINHIQSHRPTLFHLPPYLFTVSIASHVSSLSSSLSRTRRGDSPCHPSVELSMCSPSRRVPSLAPCFSALPLFRVVPRQHHRPQLTLIYVIFSGRPHVTALRRTLDQRVLDVCARYQGMRFADARSSEHGRRERETRQKYRVTEPRLSAAIPCGDIRNVNRTNQSGNESAAKTKFRTRATFFAGASPFLDDPWKIHYTIAFRDINIARRYKIRK